MCDDRTMRPTGAGAISITLTPRQVQHVVRAASRSAAPGLHVLLERGPDGPAAPPDEVADADPRLSRSLLRGLALLARFGPDTPERGIVELAGELQMSPSTAHRYALTLVEAGLLERVPRTRKYR